MLRALVASLLIASLHDCLPAQATIVVQGGGFALQQAINAALPGDRLDVLTATYSPVIVSSGITIDCRRGVVVQPGASLVSVQITNVPAFQTLVVHGGSFSLISITGCAGGVVLDGVAEPVDGRGAIAPISSCTGPVVVHRSTVGITGGTLLSGRFTWNIVSSSQVSFAGDVLPYLTISGSNVSIVDCLIPERETVSAAVQVSSGNVDVSGGHFVGGIPFSFPIPSPAFSVGGGRLTLTGSAILESGNSIYHGLTAIVTTGGAIHIDPSVQLVSSVSPFISGPAVVVQGTIPNLSFLRPPGGPAWSLTIAAEPSSLTLTAVGLPMAVQPLPFGDLWLDPRSQIFDIATMPASGTRTVTGTLPPLSPFLFLTVVLQSVSFPSAGGVVLGTPVSVVLD